MRQAVRFVTVCVVAGTLTTACAPQRSSSRLVPGPETGERQFKVSVYTDGKEVKDFRKKLIHRVALDPQTLQRMLATPPAQLNETIRTDLERGSAGGVLGLRVLNNGLSTDIGRFGFRGGDLLTAIDREPVSGGVGLRRLFEGLKQSGRASVTLERDFQPHKIYYSVVKK